MAPLAAAVDEPRPLKVSNQLAYLARHDAPTSLGRPEYLQGCALPSCTGSIHLFATVVRQFKARDARRTVTTNSQRTPPRMEPDLKRVNATMAGSSRKDGQPASWRRVGHIRRWCPAPLRGEDNGVAIPDTSAPVAMSSGTSSHRLSASGPDTACARAPSAWHPPRPGRDGADAPRGVGTIVDSNASWDGTMTRGAARFQKLRGRRPAELEAAVSRNRVVGSSPLKRQVPDYETKQVRGSDGAPASGSSRGSVASTMKRLHTTPGARTLSACDQSGDNRSKVAKCSWRAAASTEVRGGREARVRRDRGGLVC